MKYYLFIWITGCVGFNCPIPYAVEEAYDSQVECEQSLEVAMKVASITKKKYAGICIPEDMRDRVKKEWGDWNE